MKYIKLAIVLLVVAGTLGGIINLITKGKVSGDIKPEPTDVKTITIEKRIHDDIESASDNSFCITAYNDILNSINLFFQNEPSNKATYTLKLQGAYCRKFVRQANYVFDRTSWESKKITTIRKEMNRCLEFFPEDKGLDSIRQILQNYAILVSFNTKVKNACKQQPKCLDDSYYLYKLDDWDSTTTTQLLNTIPSASGKVTNSPVYRNTRLNEVRRRLKEAHTSFIERKMAKSEEEIKSFNHNPNQFQAYRSLGDNLGKCFDTYYRLWQTSTGPWREKLADWEFYVTPLDDNN